MTESYSPGLPNIERVKYHGLGGFYYNLKPSYEGEWAKDHDARTLVKYNSEEYFANREGNKGAKWDHHHQGRYPTDTNGGWTWCTNSLDWTNPGISINSKKHVDACYYTGGESGFNNIFNRDGSNKFHVQIKCQHQHYTAFNWCNTRGHTPWKHSKSNLDEDINNVQLAEDETCPFIPQVLGFSCKYTDSGSYSSSKNRLSGYPTRVGLMYVERNLNGGKQLSSTKTNEIITIQPARQLGNIKFEEHPWYYGTTKHLSYIFSNAQWSQYGQHFGAGLDPDSRRWLFVGFWIESGHRKNTGSDNHTTAANYWDFRLIVGDSPNDLREEWDDKNGKIMMAGDKDAATKSQYCTYNVKSQRAIGLAAPSYRPV